MKEQRNTRVKAEMNQPNAWVSEWPRTNVNLISGLSQGKQRNVVFFFFCFCKVHTRISCTCFPQSTSDLWVRVSRTTGLSFSLFFFLHAQFAHLWEMPASNTRVWVEVEGFRGGGGNHLIPEKKHFCTHNFEIFLRVKTFDVIVVPQGVDPTTCQGEEKIY